jgi:rSAM/selenodomain-associated transferase 2/rSAM/selenodomain-associated transferase 1
MGQHNLTANNKVSTIELPHTNSASMGSPSICVRRGLQFGQRMPKPDVAIIMPILNEGLELEERLAQHKERYRLGYLIVVVDGGSSDASETIARQYADVYVRSARGRATQMNAGADALIALKIAITTLLFLHADTELPACATDEIRARTSAGYRWGRFDVQIIGGSKTVGSSRELTFINQPWSLNLISFMMNWRSRLSGIATGDQAIFVLQSEFEAIGGYAVQALMEDIALSRALSLRGPPANLHAKVCTSGRRWETHGTVKTILNMWRLRLLYFFGTDANSLAAAYGYKIRATADIAIMAKAPIAGLAKTRLIPLLGANGAARAHRQMLLKTLATARWASTGVLTLWCASDINHRLFQLLHKRFGLPLALQQEGDLGIRMSTISKTHFAQFAHRSLIIVGTDCPYLEPRHLELVAQKLQTLDVVFIGANDGGYVLVGLRKHTPEIFESISWSTEKVMQQTLAQLQKSGRSFTVIESLADIDTPDDWQQLPTERLKLFSQIGSMQ